MMQADRVWCRKFGWTKCWLLIGMVVASNVHPRLQAAEKLTYNRDVRPILADTCFKCHGPDSAARKADLRLDQRQAAIDLGAIVPGNPDESEAIRRVFSTDAKEVMPPPSPHGGLTMKQKELLKRWVAEGAEYEPHWFFLAPQRPALPLVKQSGWVRQPLDAFVLARLEASGLSPAPEADRRTLARRLSLDLTGLPPDPAQVEAFVQDSTPDAYEKYVDLLLASPRWGEHRARYWLDVARYADTHGIHFDNQREMWIYRDWVINALNRNLRFDQFTLEQLAGDLLPSPTLDQRVASGFNRCNITTNEGGIIDEEYLVLYTRDRTETVSQVWLGMTAGCAVCHDHKFDAMSQREFYEMAAFFNNSTQGARDGNIKDTPPILPVPRAEDRPRFEQITAQLPGLRQQLAERKKQATKDFDEWKKTGQFDALAKHLPVEGMHFYAALNDGEGKTFRYQVDGQELQTTEKTGVGWADGYVAEKAFESQSGEAVEIEAAGDFDTTEAFSCGLWVKTLGNNRTGALLARMDVVQAYRGWDLWLENGRIGSHIIHQWPENALKVVAAQPLKNNTWHYVTLTYDGSSKAAVVKLYVDGVLQSVSVASNSLSNTCRTTAPLTLGQRHGGNPVEKAALQELRLYRRVLGIDEIKQLSSASRALWLARKPQAKLKAEEKNELFEAWLSTMDESYQRLAKEVADLEGEETSIGARGTVAHVMQERPQAAMAFVLFRGEYDKRRDQVTPDTPDLLPPMSADQPRNRLGFAQWLLRDDHPLTSRVTVNRFWQELFGTGIVRTSGDFGVAGELPSHPELLDWLAVEFRERGWDVKQFYKMLVTSATIHKLLQVTPEKLAPDADNRLFSRGPRFRMDAEMVRDYALAASGLLSSKIGGPSVKPYQPEGVWEAVAMIGSNTRNYQEDRGENLYRREYVYLLEAECPACLDGDFQCSLAEFCTVRRERTNTPLQALVTLNDPQFVEAARHLAQQALAVSGERPQAGIDLMSSRLLARTFRANEMPIVQASLQEFLTYYRSHPEDAQALISVGDSKPDAAISAVDLAAWTMLANELMNLDEVLNK